MKFLKISLVFSAFALFLAVGCQKESSHEIGNIQSMAKTTNLAMHKLAAIMANNATIEASSITKRVIENNASTKNEEFLLVELLNNAQIERTPDFLNEILTSNPLIEIGYPSFGFRSGISFEYHLTTIQYYVVLEYGIEPEDVETLPAYTTTGELVQISSEFDEDLNYAVIRLDEAHDAIVSGDASTVLGRNIPTDINSFTPTHINGNVKYFTNGVFLRGGLSGPPPPPPGPIGGGDPDVCDRPSEYKDQLFKILFTDKCAVKTIESGFRLPNLELDFIYIFANQGTGVDGITASVDKNWSLMNGNWQSVDEINREIRTWKEDDSDIWKITVMERDGGVSNSFSVGFSPTYTVNNKWKFSTPFTYTIPSEDKDDHAGDCILEYCDKAKGDGTPYTIFNACSGGMYIRENFHNQ